MRIVETLQDLIVHRVVQKDDVLGLGMNKRGVQLLRLALHHGGVAEVIPLAREPEVERLVAELEHEKGGELAQCHLVVERELQALLEQPQLLRVLGCAVL